MKKVLECDLSQSEQIERPEYVHIAKDGFEQMQKLLEILPTNLKIVDDINS